MNDYMFLVFCSLVTAVCLYFIIAPFFAKKVEPSLADGAKEQQTSVEAIYRAVNELEMDFLMKKITQEDFLHLKENYQLLAVDYLQYGRLQDLATETAVENSGPGEAVGAGGVGEVGEAISNLAEIDQELLAELTRIRARERVMADE